MWELITLDQVKPSPWSNGGGVTRVLIEWPDSHWHWRISVAEVASNGPFSRFNGVQRWLTILSGAGVRLDFGNRIIELDVHSAPLDFAGSDAVYCELLAGAVQDLNLMIRPPTGSSASRSKMCSVVGSLQVTTGPAMTVALYSGGAAAELRWAGGTLRLPSHTLAWRALPAGSTVDIRADRAIWMEIADDDRTADQGVPTA